MKKCIIISVILILFQCLCVKSQNLVPNGSFETISQCPIVPGRIYYAEPWFQPHTWQGNVTNSCSSDLFDTCGASQGNIDSGIPQNAQGGFQYARTGIGYAGIIPYTDTFNYREYLEVPLLDTLIANHNYCVEFYVSLANLYGTAISNLGAYFSNDSLLDNSYHAHTINYVIPQIENPIGNMLSDTLNWMLVSGNFIALGGEKFMTIGNFHLPANTNSQIVIPGNNYGSYYFIDDVSVIDCTNVGMQEANKENANFKLFPNPNNGQFSLEYHLESNQSGSLTIYDIAGKKVFSQNFNSSNTNVSFDASYLDAGVYYYEIKINGFKTKADKLVIIK